MSSSEGRKERKITLVVAVRGKRRDGSGWLSLTPPRRETFKWHSACRAMVPCYGYRLRVEGERA